VPDYEVRPDAQAGDQAERAPLYRVILYHDGPHAARYVIRVLQEVFYFNQRGAEEITLKALYKGAALCAIEALEQAAGHAEKLTYARLTATIEPEG